MTDNTYALIDRDGTIINIFTWDGVEPYDQPEGTTVVESDGTAQVGGSYENGAFIAAPVPEQPPLTGNDAIKQQISILEGRQTPRRIREAIVGVDNNWLKNLNDQIVALRAQLS